MNKVPVCITLGFPNMRGISLFLPRIPSSNKCACKQLSLVEVTTPAELEGLCWSCRSVCYCVFVYFPSVETKKEADLGEEWGE